MVALTKFNLGIGDTPPSVPADVFRPLSELYLQLSVLNKLLDKAIPVMQSPNGHYWTAAINNVGVVTWTDVGTVRP